MKAENFNLATRVLGINKRSITENKLKGEERLCCQIANFLKSESLKGTLKCGWFHVANEFGTKASHYMIAKRNSIGVIAGVPDFVFFWDGGYGFIEVKFEKGRLSQSQKDFYDYWIKGCDSKFGVVRGLEEVIKILEKWYLL